VGRSVGRDRLHSAGRQTTLRCWSNLPINQSIHSGSPFSASDFGNLTGKLLHLLRPEYMVEISRTYEPTFLSDRHRISPKRSPTRNGIPPVMMLLQQFKTPTEHDRLIPIGCRISAIEYLLNPPHLSNIGEDANDDTCLAGEWIESPRNSTARSVSIPSSSTKSVRFSLYNLVGGFS